MISYFILLCACTRARYCELLPRQARHISLPSFALHFTPSDAGNVERETPFNKNRETIIIIYRRRRRFRGLLQLTLRGSLYHLLPIG